MMGSVRRILLIVAICLAVLPAAATGIKAAVFRAGAAKADITPSEWPLPMVGTFSLRLAEKAWDPLFARAIVLDDGTTKIAIVVVDSCYCPRSLFDQAKQRIARSTGIPADHIMASATHTHTAPASRDRREVKADPGYVERVTAGIVEAVQQADRNLEPAELGWGVTAVPEEVFNRRWRMKPGGIVANPFGETNDLVRMNPPRGSQLLDRPAGPTDPDVSIVSLRSTGGRPIAILANYSLHYVGGIPPGGVSADYFGEFARLVEGRLGSKADGKPELVAIMSNGTSGDVNNINFRVPRPRAKPLQRMRAVAGRIADAVTAEYQTIQHRRDVTLAMSERVLTLDKRRPTPAQVQRAKEFLAIEDESSLPPRAKQYARWVMQLNEPPYSEELVLQAARIGDVGITAIPCEVFAEIGLEIKRKSPLEATFTIELANGHYGYLPTPRQHALGGYETWLGSCTLEIQASEKITAVLYELMDKVTPPAAKAKEACFRQATESARIAGYSLSKVQRWLHERALRDIDPQTGLYRTRGQWNYRDTAADCYPFLVWAAYVVDLEALEGPVRNVLHVEQKLCNYVDRIPARWDFDKNAKDESLSHDALIFGASEYVKDGLIAIVEVTGKDQWFERMKGIEEDIWKHARVDTPDGKIPSTNVEVNGEQIQALVRLYTMTHQEKFLTWARRLGDYYLDDEEFVPRRLRDHGCEIIGGLGLLLGVESEVDPAQAKKRLPRLRRMFDEILARGCNQDGIMYNILDAGGGRLSDGWGYDYVGNLCYDMAAGEPVYRHQVAQTLRNLAKPLYRNYAWEGKSIDGFADSIEGAIYLLNRVPVAEGFAWVDREMAANVARSHQPLETAELWGTMKLESNGVRTVIIHALMHTRGLLARPWRQDLELGACDTDDGLAIVLKADRDWSGKLVFDIPRHRLYQGFQRDWPRMNTLPEWFTVEPERQYVVCREDSKSVETHTGQTLHDGLPVTVRAGQTLQLLVVLEAK